nr:hypothetical protein [Halomicroarcula amylolytica]
MSNVRLEPLGPETDETVLRTPGVWPATTEAGQSILTKLQF